MGCHFRPVLCHVRAASSCGAGRRSLPAVPVPVPVYAISSTSSVIGVADVAYELEMSTEMSSAGKFAPGFISTIVFAVARQNDRVRRGVQVTTGMRT